MTKIQPLHYTRVCEATKLKGLTVIGELPKQGHNRKFEVQCFCGKVFASLGCNLISANTNSCGCYNDHQRKVRSIKHGLARTPTYWVWQNMKNRCHRPESDMYHIYGGRGISVCAEWHTFANFLHDMGERPEGLSIDRIDSNKGYSKDNCRWATILEQAQNKSTNRNITLNGQTHCLAVWERIKGLPPGTIARRIDSLGWCESDAVNKSVRVLVKRDHKAQAA